MITIPQFSPVGEEKPRGNLDFTLDYLVVAGGGGGGSVTSVASGGGGAGGYVEGNTTFSLGTYSIVIGAGGGINNDGNNSNFSDIVALGGGRGAIASTNPAGDGGSGGGSGKGTAGLGLQPTSASGGFGNNGRRSGSSSNGGGGGGAGGTGTGTAGRNGGIGKESTVTGYPVYYAGGGTGRLGGGFEALGGGGAAISGAGAGKPNTGGGGGGRNGGGGGSGVIIFKVPDTYEAYFTSGVVVNGQNGTPTQQDEVVVSLSIDSAGTGYSAGTLGATGGGGSGFAATYTVDGTGAIDSITITNQGSGYTSDPTIVISDPGNGDAVITASITYNVPGYKIYRVTATSTASETVTFRVA